MKSLLLLVICICVAKVCSIKFMAFSTLNRCLKFDYVSQVWVLQLAMDREIHRENILAMPILVN